MSDTAPFDLQAANGPVTVGELREFLAHFPDTDIVVMSKDAEGNGHSPLVAAEHSLYVAETTWYGDVYNPQDADLEQIEGAVRAILLLPTN